MAEATDVQPPQHPSQRRRALAGVIASASTLLVLAIVLMANYLSFRHYQRFDWTAQGIFTLSPKSKQVLRELGHDVDVYVFISRGEANFASTDELLKRYAAASSHVLLHYVDPDREAGQFKLLAQRFGVASGVLETGEARADVAIVVVLGNKNWHVNRDDLVGSELGSQPGEDQGSEEVQLKGEQAVTGAIVQVTSGRATKICLTSGHGEWTLTEGERSLSALEHALRHDNLEWKPFETLGQKLVPSECDAVLVAGPVHAFSDAEAKLVLDYARNGGNVLLALDPVIDHDQISSTGFEAPLRDAGIRLDPALVLELNKDHLLTRNPAEFVVTEFGDHVTTRPMQHNARVFLSLVRGVTPIGQDGKVEILLRTSDEGFGKTDIADLTPDHEPVKGAADVAGPVSIAVATQFNAPSPGTKKTGGRLVVIGDTDFMVAQLLDTPELQNFQLASAFVGWVAERPALIEIPPKKIKSGNIVFSQDDLWSLFFRVAVLVPAAALILGIAVWLNRRA